MNANDATKDTNALIGGLLMDLATVATAKPSAMGFQRAAKAILALNEPIESYVEPDGSLRKIQYVGPSSERVILEVLRDGSSSTVDEAVASSDKSESVAALRAMRKTFISRSRALAVLTGRGEPSVADYHGDLQMHSTWSDGTQSLREIVASCLERGYSFCGITDHSRGLPAAGGLSQQKIAAQHREIDEINAEFRDRFRIIKGIEANIHADGGLDLTPDELAQFELVLAAPHSVLRAADDQTERLISVLATPGIHILGHPRGRVYGKRSGIRADWDAVFAVAARESVAIEIDGLPSRQDIDYELARRALDAGCLFALDSDAHAPWELQGAEFALAHARLAGVPSDQVINCWPLERLITWLRQLSRVR